SSKASSSEYAGVVNLKSYLFFQNSSAKYLAFLSASFLSPWVTTIEDTVLNSTSAQGNPKQYDEYNTFPSLSTSSTFFKSSFIGYLSVSDLSPDTKNGILYPSIVSSIFSFSVLNSMVAALTPVSYLSM